MNRRYLIGPRAGRTWTIKLITTAHGEAPLRAIGFFWPLMRHSPFSRPSPKIGWWPKFTNPALVAARVFRVRGFERVLVIYRPVEDGVDILRVIHGSRNLQALLSREGVE